MQIIGLVVTYGAMAIVLITLLYLIKLDRKLKVKKCMMNHPAGSHVKNVQLPIGRIQPILQDSQTPKPYHLKGD